ncbi:MAG: T9SS type A sorting domain-containing protein [Bacteroidales bacterium]|jgi:hypothetical protein|nr:T9SS type A sorting domain-containing protein [Bacteroidales bacterium]HOL96945.1 T9SS type A sorting domain-containing protein [Bacteroidales bacterium]HOM36458.1 T9SS type A sorting domain-containing protein [Bacteroidales bacterium]HPD23969.1 T9SS type A sorting domain-containing protein [Bacteroidales bacterium]HRS98502.1 T9SS type A sorting domain-containing protein [Bacteroidales bacterium]
MKRLNNVFIFYISIFISSSIYCQTLNLNAYDVEASKYFCDVNIVDGGILLTDNYYNNLYFLKDGEFKTIQTSPGCGRYYSISHDRKTIGFKIIGKEGQTPAIFSFEQNKLIKLDEPQKYCGQPVFSDNSIAYTVDNTLHILSKNNHRVYVLENYSNYISISNDERFVAYDVDGVIYLKDLNNDKSRIISERNKNSSYPRFSPDGKKLLYQSDYIYVFEIETQKTFQLPYGLYPQWSPDSEKIIFYLTKTNGDYLQNSDIFIVDYKSGVFSNITNTVDIAEMQAVFIGENEIIYHTYNSKKIYKQNIISGEIQEINIPEFEIKEISNHTIDTKAEVLIPGEVPYTHQVYDTPDSHYGYGSCAPTCAIMAISYYNRLPKWPVSVTKLYPHISNYGNYVCTKYRFNEYYFENSATTSGGDVAYGGYGYMWGLGSPNSKMRNYIELHYFESTQAWNSSVTWNSVTNEIDNHYPLPMCAMLTSAGHLILTKGYVVGQRTLIFSEPYGDKNTPSWPSYDGHKVYYDWPGYNNGFQNLDYNGSYGVIAWTVTAHTQEVEYNDTIIDDIFFHHGFEMNNSEAGSTMRYYRDVNGGYNNHYWWTGSMTASNDICWVTWKPNLSEEGYYKISAFIPSDNATAQNAHYRIYHEDTCTIVIKNQGEYHNEWTELGDFKFIPGKDFYVYLGDSTGYASQPMAFDAVKFERINPPIAQFTVDGYDFCTNQEIHIINNSTNYLDCEWIFPEVSQIAGTSTEPIVIYDTPGIYNATLIVHGLYESDTLELNNFIKIHEQPYAYFSVLNHDLYLPESIAIFSNLSLNADAYLWNFGNGSTSMDINPYCIYTESGEYQVSLTAYNQGCAPNTYIDENPIIVHIPTSNDYSDFNFCKIYPNPCNGILKIDNNSEIDKLTILSIDGKVLFSTVKPENELILNFLDNSIYFLMIEKGENIQILKFILEK